MAINVNQWTSENVEKWLKGLGEPFEEYSNNFLNKNVDGKKLLILSIEDLKQYSINRIGHQYAIIHCTNLLKKFHYELETETLQLIALKLGCKCKDLYKQMTINNIGSYKNNKVTNSVMSKVTDILISAKQLLYWLFRNPFDDIDSFKSMKNDLLHLGTELATNAQRGVFADNPEKAIYGCCQKLAELCDHLIKDFNDSLTMQPAFLDFVRIRRVPGQGLGIAILPVIWGMHVIGDVYPKGAAHLSGNIEKGDEIIQVNYQTVVGWQSHRLLELLHHNAKDLILTLCKRPRHPTTHKLMMHCSPGHSTKQELSACSLNLLTKHLPINSLLDSHSIYTENNSTTTETSMSFEEHKENLQILETEINVEEEFLKSDVCKIVDIPNSKNPFQKINMATSQNALDDGLKGWLMRRRDGCGLLANKWARRYFILKGNTLFGYRDQKAARAEMVFHMPGLFVSPAPEIRYKRFVFKVYASACQSHSDMSNWMNKLGLAAIAFKKFNEFKLNDSDSYSYYKKKQGIPIEKNTKNDNSAIFEKNSVTYTKIPSVINSVPYVCMEKCSNYLDETSLSFQVNSNNNSTLHVICSENKKINCQKEQSNDEICLPYESRNDSELINLHNSETANDILSLPPVLPPKPTHSFCKPNLPNTYLFPKYPTKLEKNCSISEVNKDIKKMQESKNINLNSEFSSDNTVLSLKKTSNYQPLTQIHFPTSPMQTAFEMTLDKLTSDEDTFDVSTDQTSHIPKMFNQKSIPKLTMGVSMLNKNRRNESILPFSDDCTDLFNISD